MTRNRRRPNIAAGAVAGFIGGLVATFAMNRAQALWSKLSANYESQSAAGSEDARDWQERMDGTNANELAAQSVARHTMHRSLDRHELAAGAMMVHYAFGGATGAAYGALAEVAPQARALLGTAYGTAVWLLADEIIVPMIGWSKHSGEYPPEAHVQSFVSHLVFGYTTEQVRRGVERLLT